MKNKKKTEKQVKKNFSPCIFFFTTSNPFLVKIPLALTSYFAAVARKFEAVETSALSGISPDVKKANIWAYLLSSMPTIKVNFGFVQNEFYNEQLLNFNLTMNSIIEF